MPPVLVTKRWSAGAPMISKVEMAVSIKTEGQKSAAREINNAQHWPKHPNR